MKTQILVLIFLFLAFSAYSLFYFFSSSASSSNMPNLNKSSELSSREWNSTHIKIGNATILAWIADNDEKRELGLMYVKKLEENEGMIFIFEDEGIYAFWMKNTYLPLDIIFVDKNMKVVDMQSMEPCNGSECILYYPSEKIKYAIEVNSGFCSKNHINIGDQVKIEN